MAESREEQWHRKNFNTNRNYDSRNRQYHLNYNPRARAANPRYEQQIEILEHEMLQRHNRNNRNFMPLHIPSNTNTHQLRNRDRPIFTPHEEGLPYQPRRPLINHHSGQAARLIHDLRVQNLHYDLPKPGDIIMRPIPSKQDLRERHWIEYFSEHPREYLRFDFHKISRLKEIDINKPNAHFKCLVCGYYCDTLNVVNAHIEGSKHLKTLQTAFAAYTMNVLPSVPTDQLNVINQQLDLLISQNVMTHPELTKREDIAKHLTDIISVKFKACTVKLYGSSDHGLGLVTSDINLNLTLSPETNYGNVLEEVARIIMNDNKFSYVEKNFDWDFQNLTFVYNSTGADCRLRLNRERAYALSALLKLYASVDERVRKLAVVVRFWAEVSNTGMPDNGTIPRHYYYILVVFFLQRISQPILPVLNELYSSDSKQGLDTLKLLELDCSDIKEKWSTTNKKSIGELWLEFLKFYAEDFPSPDFYICITQSELIDTQKCNKFFAVIDPVNDTKIRIPLNRFHYYYVKHCLQTTYIYFMIPQTSEGPLFSAIKDKPTANDCPPLQQYIEKHIVATHNMIRTLPLLGSTFNKPVNCGNITTKVIQFLDAVHHPENVYNIKIQKDVLPDPTKPHEISVIYSDSVLFAEDAAYLMPLVKKEALHYDMNTQRVTSGKPVPPFCILCKRDGHVKNKCDDVMLCRQDPEPEPEPEVYAIMDVLCEQIYEKHVLTKEDLNLRKKVVLELETLIKELFSDVKLTLFGSSENGFGLKGCDLDICVSFESHPPGEDLDLKGCIEELYKALSKRQFPQIKELVCISTARVPIVKFRHAKTNLVGDFSILNILGLENTRLLKTYGQIDRRVIVLGIMIKYFAKVCDIGTAAKGTLSSYAYVLMVIYFLQRCTTPVLPSLQELSDNPEQLPEKIVQGWNLYYFDNLEILPQVWPEYGKNTDSIGHLWLELLSFYTEKFDVSMEVVSIKKLELFTKKAATRCIIIEDPFELTHNLGASVSRRVNAFIFEALKNGRIHFATLPSNDATPIEKYYFDNDKLTDGDVPVSNPLEKYKGMGESKNFQKLFISEDSNVSSPKSAEVIESLDKTSKNKDLQLKTSNVKHSAQPTNQESTQTKQRIHPEMNMINRTTMEKNCYRKNLKVSVPLPMNMLPGQIVTSVIPAHHGLLKPEHLYRPPCPLPFGKKNASTNQDGFNNLKSTCFPPVGTRIPNQRYPTASPFPISKYGPDNSQMSRVPVTKQRKLSSLSSESQTVFSKEIFNPKLNPVNPVSKPQDNTGHNQEYLNVRDTYCKESESSTVTDSYENPHHTQFDRRNAKPSPEQSESLENSVAELFNSLVVANQGNAGPSSLTNGNNITPTMKYVNEVEKHTKVMKYDQNVMQGAQEL